MSRHRRTHRRHKGGRNSFDTASYKSVRSNSFNTDSFDTPRSYHSTPKSSRGLFEDEPSPDSPPYLVNVHDPVYKAREEKTMADAANFINKENKKEDRWYHRWFKPRQTKKQEKNIQKFYAKDGTFEDDDEPTMPMPVSQHHHKKPQPKKWWKFWQKNTDKINAAPTATHKRRKFWPWRGGTDAVSSRSAYGTQGGSRHGGTGTVSSRSAYGTQGGSRHGGRGHRRRSSKRTRR